VQNLKNGNNEYFFSYYLLFIKIYLKLFCLIIVVNGFIFDKIRIAGESVKLPE